MIRAENAASPDPIETVINDELMDEILDLISRTSDKISGLVDCLAPDLDLDLHHPVDGTDIPDDELDRLVDERGAVAMSVARFAQHGIRAALTSGARAYRAAAAPPVQVDDGLDVEEITRFLAQTSVYMDGLIDRVAPELRLPNDDEEDITEEEVSRRMQAQDALTISIATLAGPGIRRAILEAVEQYENRTLADAERARTDASALAKSYRLVLG